MIYYAAKLRKNEGNAKEKAPESHQFMKKMIIFAAKF